MKSYTNDSLEKFRKQNVILIVSSLQSKLNVANSEAKNNILEEVLNISEAITKLSSVLFITKVLIPYCQVD